MDDATLMGRFQRFGDLLRNLQGFCDWNRLSFQTLLQRLALHQLHDDARLRRRVFKPVNLGDIGMVQTCKYLGLALESCEALGIISEVIRQELQRDVTMQFGIKSSKHHTHAAFTKR